tara:strand:- start:718 stop:1758 length:1041 start_codon:yes stop_codon:yes gene_type:complete
MKDYEFLLRKISDKIKDPKKKKYIRDNLESIVVDLKDFSNFFSKVVSITFEKIPTKDKIKKLNKIKFRKARLTKKESKDILKALKLDNIIGGSQKEKEIEELKKIHANLDKNVTFCLTNMGVIASKLFSNFPKYGTLMISKFFSDVANLYNFDWHSFEDFTKKMDWIYLYLFALASLPIVGVVFDIIIIIRSIKQDRIFLAILTFITTVISMFTAHIVDLGLIIKILYFLDVTSYTSVKNMDIPTPTEGNDDVFYNNDGRTTEVPTEIPKKIKEQVGGDLQNTTAGFFSIIHSASKNNPVTQDEKEDNLVNIQEALQNGGNNESYDKKSFFSEISSVDSNLSIESN